jgi:hypothetical protein
MQCSLPPAAEVEAGLAHWAGWFKTAQVTPGRLSLTQLKLRLQ